MRIWKDLLCCFLRESGCQTHSVTCGAGTGIFLLIRVLHSFLNFRIQSLGCLALFQYFFNFVLWISFMSHLFFLFILEVISYLFAWIPWSNKCCLCSQRTTILLQRSARQAPWPSPYLDTFGEEVSFLLTALFILVKINSIFCCFLLLRSC